MKNGIPIRDWKHLPARKKANACMQNDVVLHVLHCGPSPIILLIIQSKRSPAPPAATACPSQPWHLPPLLPDSDSPCSRAARETTSAAEPRATELGRAAPIRRNLALGLAAPAETRTNRIICVIGSCACISTPGDPPPQVRLSALAAVSAATPFCFR